MHQPQPVLQLLLMKVDRRLFYLPPRPHKEQHDCHPHLNGKCRQFLLLLLLLLLLGARGFRICRVQNWILVVWDGQRRLRVVPLEPAGYNDNGKHGPS